MMWQIGLTVVSAEEFTQIRFHHRSLLEWADGVLVMCLGQHYVLACKYSFIFAIERMRIATRQLAYAPGQLYLATGWMYYHF